MVLHNNKWDRQAKIKYLKKHNISSESTKKQSDKKTKSGTHGEAGNDNANERSAIQFPDQFSINRSPGTGSPENGQAEIPEADSSELLQRNSEEQQIDGVDLFPEFEEDDEQAELIRKHIAKQRLKPEEDQKTHIQTVDKSVFENAQAGVERSKLNQRVKRIGAKSRGASNIELDSDSDFDDFMDNLDSDNDEREEHVSIPKPKNTFANVELEESSNEPAASPPSPSATPKTAADSKKIFLDKLLQ